MDSDDERARIREVDRAVQARAITESPLWDEAYRVIINTEMERMLSASTSDEETIECKRRIAALQTVKRHFATLMQTGDMAQRQLEEARKHERNR